MYVKALKRSKIKCPEAVKVFYLCFVQGQHNSEAEETRSSLPLCDRMLVLFTLGVWNCLLFGCWGDIMPRLSVPDCRRRRPPLALCLSIVLAYWVYQHANDVRLLFTTKLYLANICHWLSVKLNAPCAISVEFHCVDWTIMVRPVAGS